MKRSISLALVTLLAFAAWTVLAFGKVKKEEAFQNSAQAQITELNLISFPEIMLPQPPPVRPTAEDFQREILEHKNIIPENLEAMRSKAVPFEFEPEDKDMFYCRVRNQVGDAYYYLSGTEWLSCWGQEGIATFLDLDHNYYTNCPYPLYPFRASKVQMMLASIQDTCTFILEAKIYGVDYSGGGPYPFGELYSSDSTNPTVYKHPGGNAYASVNLLDTLNSCLYVPFFAVMVIDNTDDFDTAGSPYCPSAPYKYWPSWIFDISGRKYQSYINIYGLGGSWYDVVEYGIESGAIRVEVYGYTKAENTCPNPQETWYFKDPYPPGAPCGVPDFDQYQMPGPAFCGPSAGANSIWWFAARGDFPASWGGLTPADVPALINEVATASGTNPASGTECDSLQAGVLEVIKAHGGWWFEETTVYAPDFWYIQKELRDCENVILLLGFWQEDPPGTWKRFGGHFVTLSGVDIFNLAFAFSDPAIDNAENGFPGKVCHTDTFPHPGNPLIHNNTANISYDYYNASWPSTSPGGYLYLPDYASNWPVFQDQNFRPEHQIYHGTFNPALPVKVEIEQAIVVSPGLREMQGEVQSSKAYEIENNHGGIDAFGVDFGTGIIDGLYKGSLVLGPNQDDLNCDYGDYYPIHTFDPLGPPVLDSFTITGSAGDYRIYQLTIDFAHRSIPDLKVTKYAFGFWVPVGGTLDCEYVIEDVYVFHNTGAIDITGLQAGMLFDYDIGTSNNCEVDFDQQHQSIWMWEDGAPSTVFGLTKKPAVASENVVTGWGLSNPARIYDGQYVDSLKYWMENLGWGVDNPGTYEDKSILMSAAPFNLPVDGMFVEKWIKWGYKTVIATGGDAAWRHFLYNVLHQEGFYRGDVNQDGKLSISDVVYLIKYVLDGGPSPKEFVDQGDVNNDGVVNVVDIPYIVNYLFHEGAAPIDKNRFLANSPYVDPAHQALATRNPGLFGEPNWMYLGR